VVAHYLTVLLFGLPLVAFLLGLSRVPTWSCVLCPLIEVIAWTVLRLAASPDDDMLHAYLWVGLIFAIACAVGWSGGRAIRMWVRWASRK
jgi:hypothetical protein